MSRELAESRSLTLWTGDDFNRRRLVACPARPDARYGSRRLRIAWAPLIDWLAVFISMLGLQLVTLAGAPAVLMFLVPPAWFLVQKPQTAVRALARHWPLQTFAAVALGSVFWSEYPAQTFRAGFQLSVTLCVGVWLASCVKPQLFLSALVSSLTAVTLAGVAFGSYGVIDPLSGEEALTGLFDSKNSFSFSVVNLLFAAVAVLSDGAQQSVFRLMSIAALAYAPPILMAAKSVGAMVICAAAIVAITALKMFDRTTARARITIMTGALLLSAPLVVLAMAEGGDAGSLLNSLGKDSTLTGRAYIWQRAYEFIAEQPILGVGYQAFWQVGNSRAEELWYSCQVPSGAGFNFHNLYLHILVDLGVLGLVAMGATLVVVAGRVMRVALNPLQPHQLYGVGVFVFLMLSSTIEVSLTYQFHLGTVLLCLIWVYLSPPSQSRR